MKHIDFNRQLVVLKSNRVYRVGDLFLRAGERWRQDRDTILTDSKYKDTILYHYLTHKNKERDYAAFREAVIYHGTKKEFQSPIANELVIHLRTGDSMDLTLPYNISNRIPDLERKINKIKHITNIVKDITKISIVTALHFGDDDIHDSNHYNENIHNSNIKYLQGLERDVNNLGYELNLVSNSDIDQDIFYMMKSKHFLKSISNLSDIIARCTSQDTNVYENV